MTIRCRTTLDLYLAMRYLGWKGRFKAANEINCTEEP